MTRVLPCGSSAWLVELDGIAHVHALVAELGRGDDHRIGDVVPGARTVLVRLTDPVHREPVAAALRDWAPPDSDGDRAAKPPTVTIAVRYDGPDLDDVADLTGLSAQEVVRRHRESDYVVDFLGFAPGFAYLGGLDDALHVSRLDTPRTSVPAGAVAIAGDKTAVYPRSSPGGWRLIGSTDEVLFDLDADPPALLRAGMRVRFEEIR